MAWHWSIPQPILTLCLIFFHFSFTQKFKIADITRYSFTRGVTCILNSIGLRSQCSDLRNSSYLSLNNKKKLSMTLILLLKVFIRDFIQFLSLFYLNKQMKAKLYGMNTALTPNLKYLRKGPYTNFNLPSFIHTCM